MAGRKGKRIDKALKAARSAELRARKDPYPDWMPADGEPPDTTAEASPAIEISVPLPPGQSPAFDRPLFPPLSLRGGDAIDDGEVPPPYDAVIDRVTPEYLEKYSGGIFYLDPVSWRYYLPIFIGYAFSNVSNPASMAVDRFLFSLRPPDREPSRFNCLSQADRDEIVFILDKLAFEDSSAWKEPATTALEEYWAPGALYRSDEGT
jgi:hypothetical protein